MGWQDDKVVSTPSWENDAVVKGANMASKGNRFLQGLRDPIDTGAQLLTHMLPQSAVDAGNTANNWLADKTGLVANLPEGGLDKFLADRESSYQSAREEAGNTGVDWMRMAGNIASPANLAIASKIPAAATLPGRVLAGMGGGAAMGAVSSPVTKGDFWTEKAKQAGLGAAAGGAATLIGEGVARVISPKVSKYVSDLMDSGVTPTPGQIIGGRTQVLEDKLTSLPVLGDAISSARGKGLDEFNRAVYAKTLEPIGGTIPKTVGRQAVSEVHQQIRSAYDALLPKLQFQADPGFVADIAKVTSMASSMPKTQAQQFQKVFAEKVVARMGPQGTMDGATLKGVESELGRLAKGYLSDPSFDNRQLGAAIGELQSSIRDALARTNPNNAQELAAINKSFAYYAKLRDAASRQGALDGKFTPAQLSAAVRAADKTVGKRAFSEGTAMLQDLSDAGKSVLSSKYPDSGTAGRVAAGALTAGGLPYLSPTAATIGGVATLPYLPGGRQTMAALLTKGPLGLLGAGPSITQPIANSVRQTSPFLSPAVMALLRGSQPAEQVGP